DRRLRGDRRRIRGGAPRPGPRHRGRVEAGRHAMSTRRRLASVFGAAVLFAGVPSAHAEPPARPRLLLAERDPFTGLPALKARYAAGARPSDDLPGWALTYLLSGDESFARKGVEHLRSTP